MITKSNKKIHHLCTLEKGESFHIPSSKLHGTVITHGAMGVRVVLDGVVHYKADGKIVRHNGEIQIIGNQTEVLKYEDNNSSKRLEAITKMDNTDIDDSGATQSSDVQVRLR